MRRASAMRHRARVRHEPPPRSLDVARGVELDCVTACAGGPLPCQWPVHFSNITGLGHLLGQLHGHLLVCVPVTLRVGQSGARQVGSTVVQRAWCKWQLRMAAYCAVHACRGPPARPLSGVSWYRTAKPWCECGTWAGSVMFSIKISKDRGMLGLGGG